MDNSMRATCSLNLRRVNWNTAYALYILKAYTGRPVCALANEALQYWLQNGLADHLREALRNHVDQDGDEVADVME
jgi:hypothetical protein